MAQGGVSSNSCTYKATMLSTKAMRQGGAIEVVPPVLPCPAVVNPVISNKYGTRCGSARKGAHRSLESLEISQLPRAARRSKLSNPAFRRFLAIAYKPSASLTSYDDGLPAQSSNHRFSRNVDKFILPHARRRERTQAVAKG